jgi:hypothetical protein
MDRIYDERYGDIHFDEEDPHSEFFNPKCCRDLYLDLVNGVFDQDIYIDEDNYDNQDNYDEDYYDEEDYDESYYDADNEFDDY